LFSRQWLQVGRPSSHLALRARQLSQAFTKTVSSKIDHGFRGYIPESLELVSSFRMGSSSWDRMDRMAQQTQAQEDRAEASFLEEGHAFHQVLQVLEFRAEYRHLVDNAAEDIGGDPCTQQIREGGVHEGYRSGDDSGFDVFRWGSA